jgi:hypothetical protein
MLLKRCLFPNTFAEMVWENNVNACTVDLIRMKVIATQFKRVTTSRPTPTRLFHFTFMANDCAVEKFKWAPSFCSNPTTLSGNKVRYLFFILGTHSCDSPRGNSGKLRQNNCTWHSPPLPSVSQNVILRCVNTAKFVKKTNGAVRTEQKTFGLFRNYARFLNDGFTRGTKLKIIR